MTIAAFDLQAYAADALGPLWFAGLAAAFVTGICESARPAEDEGTKPANPGPLVALSAVASLLTPFLLLTYAFYVLVGFDGIAFEPGAAAEVLRTRTLVLAGLVALMFGLTFAAAIPGRIVAAAAPGLGRTLYRAAPYLAVATLVFVASFSHTAVLRLLHLVLAGDPN
mgnify:CR=1 FL=1